MTPELFAKLAAQNFNRIPITRQVLADLETPLSVYLKLALGPNSYLFESVQGGEKWGRYSLIGLQTSTVLKLLMNLRSFRVEFLGSFCAQLRKRKYISSAKHSALFLQILVALRTEFHRFN